MKRSALMVCAMRLALLWCLPLIATAGISAGDEKQVAQADKTPPQSINIPEIDSLRWLNLKLDAQSRRNKAEALLGQANQLDQQADSIDLETRMRLCRVAGVNPDDYFIQQAESGRVLVRKPKITPENNPENAAKTTPK